MPPSRPSAKKATRTSQGSKRVSDEIPTPPPRVTLIVGTDTGVGKTWVTTALARALMAAGQPVVAVKPIETGVTDPANPGEDGVRLAEATGQSGPMRALVRLTHHVAPAIAADLGNHAIDYEDLVARIRAIATPGTELLVEGTGGLLSPLTWSDNHLDLAHSLEARVLLVAADRLGTISHTLMALRVLAAEKIPVLGVVLNQPGPRDESSRFNASALTRLADPVPVVTLPNLNDEAQATEAVKEVAGWLLP